MGQGERITEIFSLVHTDVCGLFDVSIREDYLYFITFIDDYSRYRYMYLMRYKSEAFEKFKEFRNEVEKQIKKKFKVLRLDQRGEYLSKKILNYLKAYGIVSQWTPSRMHQVNKILE